MDYELFETEIVNRLQALPSTDTIKMPENEADHEKPFQKSRISVFYSGSKYKENDRPHPMRALGQVVQNEIVSFELLIQSRKLRGPIGILPVYKDVKMLLSGFKPSSCEKIYCKSFEFITLDKNIWTYKACFETTTLSVQDEWDEEDGEPFASAEFNQTITPYDAHDIPS